MWVHCQISWVYSLELRLWKMGIEAREVPMDFSGRANTSSVRRIVACLLLWTGFTEFQ
jgi:hypothetical protein